MARIGDDLRRAVLRAGPVENVRPCLHGAGEVRPPLGQRRRQRLAGGVRRLRRSAARQGSRLDQHTPPQAPVHRADGTHGGAVQMGAQHGEAVGQNELPVQVVRGVFGRRRGAAAAGEGSHRLRCVRRRATRARRGPEAAQVCRDVSGDHGATGQSWILAGHRRQAGC